MNLPELISKLASDEACRKHLEAIRWPEGVTCPNCGGKSVSRAAKRRVYDCNKCRRQWSVTSGTIFHDTHLPLQTWFLAIHRISESKKGVSANQLSRELAVSYKTAWYLCHRIRAAMSQPTRPGLRGIIEIDETFVKGEGIPKGEKPKRGAGSQRMTPVVGMKQRKGQVRAKAVRSLRRTDTMPWIEQNLDEEAVSAVYTDATTAYDDVDYAILRHEKVDHDAAWVLGDVHTNGIESFWSLFKRGIVGSYHHVSRKHLQRYVDEYCWRSNRDKGDDIFASLLHVQAEAQPLRYDSLLGKGH